MEQRTIWTFALMCIALIFSTATVVVTMNANREMSEGIVELAKQRDRCYAQRGELEDENYLLEWWLEAAFEEIRELGGEAPPYPPELPQKGPDPGVPEGLA